MKGKKTKGTKKTLKNASRAELYRQKYSNKKRKKEIEEIDTSGGNSEGLKINNGINYFRFFPPKLEEKRSNFFVVKGVHWLPFLKDDEDYVNKPIFNARIHSNRERDLIETYISFVKEQVRSITDSSERERILAIFKSYKTNPGMSLSFIAYATEYKKDDKGYRKRGELEFKTSVKDGIISFFDEIEEESDGPISLDPITDPEDGLVIKIKYNKDARKSSDYYNTTATKIELPMTEEDFDWLEAQESLEEKYGNAYAYSDFELALSGLENFEEKFDLDFLEMEEFEEVIAELKEEILSEDEEEEEDDEEEDNDVDEGEDEEEDEDEDDEDDDEEEEDEDDDDELTWEDLLEMDREELVEMAKETREEYKDFKIRISKKTTEESLREKLANFFEIEIVEEEEEEEEEQDDENASSKLSALKKRLRKTRK